MTNIFPSRDLFVEIINDIDDIIYDIHLNKINELKSAREIIYIDNSKSIKNKLNIVNEKVKQIHINTVKLMNNRMELETSDGFFILVPLLDKFIINCDKFNNAISQLIINILSNDDIYEYKYHILNYQAEYEKLTNKYYKFLNDQETICDKLEECAMPIYYQKIKEELKDKFLQDIRNEVLTEFTNEYKEQIHQNIIDEYERNKELEKQNKLTAEVFEIEQKMEKFDTSLQHKRTLSDFYNNQPYKKQNTLMVTD